MRDKPIHVSCIKNRPKELIKLLKKDNIVDSLGEYDCTPLHYACREKNLDIIKVLLANGANVNSKNRYSTFYPIFDVLTSMVKKDSFQIVKLLIDKGVDIDAVDSFGNTALHYAVEKENLDLIELIIKSGCDVNKTLRHDNDTPLHYACFQKNRRVVSFLIKNGANRRLSNCY
jgi:ankyrin repeat protein